MIYFNENGERIKTVNYSSNSAFWFYRFYSGVKTHYIRFTNLQNQIDRRLYIYYHSFGYEIVMYYDFEMDMRSNEANVCREQVLCNSIFDLSARLIKFGIPRKLLDYVIEKVIERDETNKREL